MNSANKSLTLLIKPYSSGCDLNCGYCFYKDVSDNRKVKNYGKMSEDIAEQIVIKAFATGASLINYGFQGGEPTLVGLNFYKNFVNIVNKYNVNNTQVLYSLQTNGMHIDNEYAEFFKANNFLIGLSLDGDKAVNDLYRVDLGGNSVFDRVMSALKLLIEHNVEFNILSVVTNASSKQAKDIYNFFKSYNLRYLQFIPCINDFNSHEDMLSAECYADFLKNIFDLWYDDLIQGNYVSIRQFDNYLSLLMGRYPENCAMGGICGEYYVIESNGDTYPCDFYCTDKHKLCNIKDEQALLMTNRHQDFIKQSYLIHNKCKSCNYYFLCRGGCKRDRGANYINNKYCKSYKSFFTYTLERLKKAAQLF